MIYATESDLANYLAIMIADLPTETGRLLERASELVDEISLNNIDTTNDDHLLAAKKATCAQVEYWIQAGESVDVMNVEGFSLGSFSVSKQISTFSPRAKRFLLLEGLLFRGVKLSRVSRND